MKNSYRFSLLTFCVLVTVVLTAGVATADIFTYTAILSGANEVPPVVTEATGMAVLVIDQEDGDLNAVPLHVEFSGLSSAQTAAHIHQAPAGLNGAAIFVVPMGDLVNTTVPFDLPMMANLISDGLYLNVHSAEFPGGEIRGQFLLSDTVATENTTWGTIKTLYR